MYFIYNHGVRDIDTTTCDTRITGMCGTTGGDYVVSSLMKEIDIFSNEFLKANPPKPKSDESDSGTESEARSELGRYTWGTCQEASAFLAGLSLAEFTALDFNGNGELSQAELEVTGAVPPSTGGGCRSKSSKTLNDLKDFFGDLFLLGLLSIVLVAWRGYRVP